MPLIAKLRRVTTDGRYVAELDGLRFAAIVSVLLYHTLITVAIAHPGDQRTNAFWFNLHTFTVQGDRGVPLFFVISGMVLGLPFARERLLGGKPVKMKAYFLRRVTRLEPPYIVNLLLRAPLLALKKHMAAGAVLTHLAVSVAYADWAIYGSRPVLHGPSWSLAIEVQFYVLAALLAMGVFHTNTWVRRTLTVLAIAVCTVVAAHLSGPPLMTVARLSLLAFGQFFLVGMLAADLYLTVLPDLKTHWVWDVICIPLWVVFFRMPPQWADYLMTPILLVLVLGVFRAPLCGRFFRSPFVSVVGGMCYSIYLTHSLLLELAGVGLEHVMVHSNFWVVYLLLTALFLPLALLVGAVFYVLVERPCMDRRWPEKLWAWMRGRPVESGA